MASTHLSIGTHIYMYHTTKCHNSKSYPWPNYHNAQSYCMAERKCSYYWRVTVHGSLVMAMPVATGGHIGIDASYTIRRPLWPG